MNARMTVAVIDDHPLLREGVSQALSRRDGFDVVALGSSADDAIRIAKQSCPDIMLVDLSMPGGGLVAVEAIRASAPTIKLVVLTVSEFDDDVLAALQLGARGYVLKGIGGDELADLLERIGAGDSYVSPSLAARLITGLGGRLGAANSDDPLGRLTAREEEILRHLVKGRSNKEIARSLDLQEKTIKHHMTSILGKLGASNRTEAALLFQKRRNDR